MARLKCPEQPMEYDFVKENWVGSPIYKPKKEAWLNKTREVNLELFGSIVITDFKESFLDRLLKECSNQIKLKDGETIDSIRLSQNNSFDSCCCSSSSGATITLVINRVIPEKEMKAAEKNYQAALKKYEKAKIDYEKDMLAYKEALKQYAKDKKAWDAQQLKIKKFAESL